MGNPSIELLSAAKKSAPLLIYSLIVLFLVCLYWFMTMTGEDMFQAANFSQRSLVETLTHTYNYIPRVGEMYQSAIIRWYEPIARLNMHSVPRLLDVMLAGLFFYVLAWFARLRPPCLDMRSALMVGLLFIILMVTRAHTVFMDRFCCLHNYALGYLITLIFCLPFASHFLAGRSNRSTATQIGLFAAGVLTGYSTELTPPILLVLLGLVLVVAHKHRRTVEPWMIAALSGLAVGILLFHLGGGLKRRINGPYASDYQYLFGHGMSGQGFASLVHEFVGHLAFNARYLWPALLFFASASLVYFALSNAAAKDAKTHPCPWKGRGVLMLFFLLYSSMYLCASGVIRVEDDLYDRFMFGIYVCVALSVVLLCDTGIFEMFRLNDRTVALALSAMAGLIMLINADMLHAFRRYNNKCQQLIRHSQQLSSISISESQVKMDDSLLFGFQQGPILEEWANPIAFGVKIQYVD